MKEKFLFIIDPLSSLKPYKDTSIFMMQYGSSNGFDIFCCEIKDLYVMENQVGANAAEIKDPANQPLEKSNNKKMNLDQFCYVFMRKDPPVDQDFLNALYLLEKAAHDGVRIINHPASLQKFNEKVLALRFAQYMPHTVIGNDLQTLHDFKEQHESIIVKPLDGMGGDSIYKFDQISNHEEDIFKKLTNNFSTQIMLQDFLPDIYDGDYRILIIHGVPEKIALARIPQKGSFKGNLAAGGTGIAKEITQHQFEVASLIGVFLKAHDIAFAGIDMIGEYLTEINITSPTGAREIYDQSQTNTIKNFFDNL